MPSLIPLEKIKKIVVVRPDALGDMVLTLPCIQAIRRQFPHWHITVLASPYNARIIRHLDYIDDIILDWTKTGKIHSFKDRWRYSQFLRDHHFDLAIHFYSETETVWPLFFAGIPYHIGDKAKLGLWPVFRNYGRFLKTFDQTKHVVEYNFQLLEAIGVSLDPANTPLQLPVPDNERVDGDKRLHQAGRRSDVPLIIIQIGVGFGNRPIEPEKFADYINLLRKTHDVDVCVSPFSEKEKEFTKRFTARLTGTALVIPDVPIMGLLGLVSHCSVFVSVDTGPFHMTAAAGVPMLAIFPSRKVKPTRWAPWRTRHWIVRESRQCPHFCPHEGCPLTVCSDAILAQDLVNKTISLLNGGGVVHPKDQFAYWFAESMSVLLLHDAQTDALTATFEAHLTTMGIRCTRTSVSNPSLPSLLIEKDITIIHNFSKKRCWRLWLIARQASLQLFNPPVIVNQAWDLDTSDAIIDRYRTAFKNQLL